MKAKQEESAKASNETMDWFELSLKKLRERLSNEEEETFLLALATNAFVEAGKGLIAFNLREERGNARSWMEVETGLEELVVAMRQRKQTSREKKSSFKLALERAIKLQHAAWAYRASGQDSCPAFDNFNSLFSGGRSSL